MRHALVCLTALAYFVFFFYSRKETVISTEATHSLIVSGGSGLRPKSRLQRTDHTAASVKTPASPFAVSPSKTDVKPQSR